MGFLNPLWLLLAGAVAVPLILHLLQRHQGPRVIFPAMRYLKRAEREHARRIRMRQILLMLLRVAIVLLLAFAAARPFIRGAGIGHEPSAVVLVLDNSLSSGLVQGDRRVLDELKQRALETLERAGPDDRFWLLRAGAPWEPALPGDAQMIAQRVRETQPTAAATDLIAAVARARNILAQGAQGRAGEVEVLSDLQNSNLHGALPKERAPEPSVLLWSPKRKPVANASVESVTLGGGLAPRAGERSSVVAEIGGTTTDSVNVRLSVDGRIAGAAVTRAGSAAVIALPARAASLVTGEVQIDADALRADDHRFFVATVLPPPRVALTRATPFLSEALSVLAGANRISVANNGAADVLIAPAGNGTEAAAGNASVVIIAPETPLELPAVNRHLASLGINWRYEQANAGERKFAPPTNADELQRSLQSARVMQAYRLVAGAASRGDSVMLRLEDGSPWAVRGARAQGGRFVLLASPLTIQATTLPTSAAMIPLLDRLTGTWSTADAPRAEAQPGERVTLATNADQIIDPDGNRVPVSGATFDAADQPGVYRVVSHGQVVGAFVVNGARSESDLRYADGARVARALEPLDVKRVDDADGWKHNVFRHRVGREVWRVLLFLVLALLLVETFAAATGRILSNPVPAQT